MESANAPATIETRWDSLGGMKYLQNGEELSGPRLKSLLDSTGDPRTSALLSESESNETLGIIGLAASAVGSAVCLFLPGTDIHLGTLKISAPYLPLQIPSLAFGLAASFLSNAAGAAKYGAVQRYNGQAVKKGRLSWNLSAGPGGLALDLNLAI